MPRNMKKLIFALCAVAALSACNTTKMDREIFTKKVFLVQNGFQEFEMSFTENSIVDTCISVGVSGTQLIDESIRISVKVNPDTLAGYNFERFRYDESQYFDLLPENCYLLKTDNILIRAGKPIATIPITFNMVLMDRDKRYVLPLEIASTSKYELAEPEYRTVLLNIVPSNAFSGPYSLSGKISEVGTEDETDIRMTRTFRAESKNTVSLYAGSTAENVEDREDFRILLKINPDSTLAVYAMHADKIDLRYDAPNLDPENPVNRIRVVETYDTQNSHRKFVTTYYYLNYNYIDYTLPDPVEMRWEGTASRTRTVLEP